jgi:peroxiredoxin
MKRFLQNYCLLAAASLILTASAATATFANTLAKNNLTESAAMSISAPDFSLRALDGATISSATTRGKVVVLAFGATWLPLSNAQAQNLQLLANKYAARGVEVFWVSTDSDSQKSKNFASDAALRAFGNKNHLKVAILRDPDGATVKRAFGVDQVPSLVVLDRQGNVATTLNGYDTQSNLVAEIGAQLDKLLQ